MIRFPSHASVTQPSSSLRLHARPKHDLLSRRHLLYSRLFGILPPIAAQPSQNLRHIRLARRIRTRHALTLRRLSRYLCRRPTYTRIRTQKSRKRRVAPKRSQRIVMLASKT